MKPRFLTLIGCATLVSMTGCPQGQDIATTISEVQTDAVKACSFLPVADSIAKLIPYVSTASGIVDLLCKSLAQAQSSGTTRAAAAALPGSNIAVPVGTPAGTVIVQGSLVQPGGPGPQRSSSSRGDIANPASTGIGNGGNITEVWPGANRAASTGIGNGGNLVEERRAPLPLELVPSPRPASTGIGNGGNPVEHLKVD
jgi:hypothetical protein